jgi:hypothetical protein
MSIHLKLCHRAANKYLTWQDICLITFNFGRTKTNITKFGRTYIRHKIYISHETSMYSHSGATLSKMLECLVNFIAKYKLSEFAIGFCHSKKMYVTIFFVIRPMSDQNYLPNLVGHCPMSDSNLQSLYQLDACLWPPHTESYILIQKIISTIWLNNW